MYQLVIAVMVVGISAMLLSGGSSYLNPEFGIRASTTEQAIAGQRSFELALAAYRIANGGAMPGETTWRNDLAPYLPDGRLVRQPGEDLRGAMSPPRNMRWEFEKRGGRYQLCLRSTGPISGAAIEGLKNTLSRAPGTLTNETNECGAQIGNVVLKFELQAGA
ncbi:hypothetical protein [Bosea sp. RAC05]|uniref:hypothetical protein n=1 Tax=Bosea sp. RAC05 TaxID=1842539 RepID=UPI00083D4C7D|nr:hypothetical protein [Bosea sp. RAC05]AOG03060.1 hypothetical protein BSY19_4924 [Bosea sp. RAC05]